MNIHQLDRAAASSRRLKEAKDQLAALKDYRVTSVTVDRGEGGLGPITLARGCSGSGTISGIGFPIDLANALTDALKKVFQDRVEAETAALMEYGVEVAD